MNNVSIHNASNNITVMEKAYKFSEIIAQADIIPSHYRGKPANVFIAVQSALRMNLDPMMVMQNTFVISGKLGMNSAFAISLANGSGCLKSGITYDIEGSEDSLKVTAKATLKSSGVEISYSIGMKEAMAEGWTKNPKYSSLPELMLRYRAATLLIRTHMPEVLNGMHMTEELEDVESAKTMRTVESPVAQTNKATSLLDSFLEVEEIVTNSMEDAEIIEAAPTIHNDNCLMLQGLIAQHKISQELVSKWCNAGGVATLEELDNNKVQSCIDYIIKRTQDDSNVSQDIER